MFVILVIVLGSLLQLSLHETIDGPLEIPALGRDFKLGDLYDVTSDSVHSGFSLWNSRNVSKNTIEKLFDRGQFSIITDETYKNVIMGFEMGISITLSINLGFFKIKKTGSASFFHERIISNYRTRVSLKYGKFTHLKELAMEALSEVDYPTVLERQNVTHVVIRVEYGAQAFLSLETESKNIRDKQETKGNLKTALDILLGLLNLNKKSDSNQKDKFSHFAYKYHGDIDQRQPKNFDDAVQIYRNLPSKITRTNTVPQKVYLLPVSRLNRNVYRLLKQIRLDIQQQLEDKFEQYDMIQKLMGDIMFHSLTFHYFPTFKKQIDSFNSSVSAYWEDFQRNAKQLVQAARGGGVLEEQALMQLLQDEASSPYSLYTAYSWLEWKLRESKAIDSMLKWKEHLIKTQPGSLDSLRTSGKNVIVFSTDFYPSTSDKFVECLKSPSKAGCKTKTVHESWLLKQVAAGVREKFRIFQQLYLVKNVGGGNSEFAMVDKNPASSTHQAEQVTLLWYRGNSLRSRDFHPPTIQGMQASIKGKKVFLSWRFNGGGVCNSEFVFFIKSLDNKQQIGPFETATSKPSAQLSIPRSFLHQDLEISMYPQCNFGTSLKETTTAKPVSCWTQWESFDSPIMYDGPTVLRTGSNEAVIATLGWNAASRGGPPEVWLVKWSNGHLLESSWFPTSLLSLHRPALIPCVTCKYGVAILYKHVKNGHIWLLKPSQVDKSSSRSIPCCKSLITPAVSFDTSPGNVKIFLQQDDGSLTCLTVSNVDSPDFQFPGTSSVTTLLAPKLGQFQVQLGRVVAPPSVVGTVLNRKSSLHVFAAGYLGNDTFSANLLQGNLRSLSWSKIVSRLAYAPAAAVLEYNQIHLFYVGSYDQILWHLWFDPEVNEWKGPFSLEGVLSSRPSAISWNSNRIDIFGRNDRLQLTHRRYDLTLCTA